MALIKCKECGNEISTKAISCPKCGAEKPKNTLSGATVFFGLIFGVPIVVWLLSSPTQTDAPAKPLEPPTNFSAPLYTKRAALVCPIEVAIDLRDGRGLKGAMDAHISIFGHDEAIAKSGCQEWREGVPVSLTDEGKKGAVDWESKGMCGMVSFGDGFISSCDLKN